jgi:hypothetical protein
MRSLHLPPDLDLAIEVGLSPTPNSAFTFERRACDQSLFEFNYVNAGKH